MMEWIVALLIQNPWKSTLTIAGTCLLFGGLIGWWVAGKIGLR
jgi:hypothetical protein